MTTDAWLRKPLKEWLPTSWYGGFLDGLPDLCVGKLPAAFGRYGVDPRKVWSVETPAGKGPLIDARSIPVPRRGGVVEFVSGPGAVDKHTRPQHRRDPDRSQTMSQMRAAA